MPKTPQNAGKTWTPAEVKQLKQEATGHPHPGYRPPHAAHPRSYLLQGQPGEHLSEADQPVPLRSEEER